MGKQISPGRHVIIGTVEKEGKVFLLMDSERESGESASYNAGSKRRFVDLVPAEFQDYEKYKSACQNRIGRIKKARKSGRLRTEYVFQNGERVGISAKKPVIDNFLMEDMFREFIRTVSEKTRSTTNVHDAVPEERIRKFFSQGKGKVLEEMKRIKNDIYTHDAGMRRIVEKNSLSIVVIMPTYNEINFERNIQLVDNVKRSGLLSEIIITDGYSVRHEPSEVLRSLEGKGKKIDCAIIRQNGAGKGEAIEAAVKYALTQEHDFCIIVDSDNMPALSRVLPNTPVDIDIEFFLRRFIQSITGQVKKGGVNKVKNTFFKASYMRMPQLKKDFELRFGLVTRIVKDFYARALGSKHNLYALSGEVAFNPKFLLENMSLDMTILENLGLPKGQYCGSNVPGGFCLETVWNSIIDIMNYDVCYVNTYLHHHGPVVKSTKTDIGEQIGEVLTGTFAGMLTGLVYSGKKDRKITELLKKIPLDVLRPDRFVLDIRGKKIRHTDIQ